MKYLTLKSDVIIYADSSKSAGVIDELEDPATGTVISGKFLKIIEQSLLADSPEPVPGDAEKLLEEFTGKTKFFGLQETRAEVGSKQESGVEDGSSFSISNQNVNEPKGKKITRKIGDYTIYYYVADVNLKGTITTTGELFAGRFSQKGPELVAEGSVCGACGMCGACGICAVCGEVNAASAVLAATALSAVIVVMGRQYAFDPQKRHEAGPEKKSYSPEFLQQVEKLNALLK